jgi:hypothetical protein
VAVNGPGTDRAASDPPPSSSGGGGAADAATLLALGLLALTARARRK